MSLPEDRRSIRVLPERVANKIAAGEVVERPASVVKELVENSLDAGASAVKVEAEVGGRRLIRVTDDGVGMTPDEALLSLERHATSKIGDEKDLFEIFTFGFRGEALPSIASVSRFELLTRARGRDEGVRIRAEGGVVKSVEPAGCAPGAVATVRNLFYNVPARLKFLRAKATELGHITDTITRMALGRPDAHFIFTHDGREVLDAPPSEDRSGRIIDALGMTTFQSMRPARAELGPESVIHGYVSLPQLHRSSGSNMFIYVNGRFVRDRLINHAVMQAYRGLLPKGRYPVALILIDVPPADVDVNVHPTKAEVRFREGGRIHDGVRMAVLGAFERQGASESTGPLDTEQPVAQASRVARIHNALHKSVERLDHGEAEKRRPFHRAPWRGKSGDERAPSGGFQGIRSLPGAARPVAPVTSPRPDGYFSSLKALGQVRNTYIVCQGVDGIILIDQHAAHERSAFERLKKDYADRRIQQQALLFPETLELGLKESRDMNRVLEAMNSLGFDIEPFGGNSFLVRALPAILGDADPLALTLDLLEALSDARAGAFQDKMDGIFARLSCHAVVRAGKSMSMDEIRALLKALDEADYPLTCPHGRPISVRITYEELEKMFGRR